MAPYESAPPFTHPPGEYQPPFPAQSEYDPAFSLAAADAPMPVPSPAPSGGSRGIPGAYYSPLAGPPSNPPVQTRGLRVSQSSRSHTRMPLITQEADARDPTRRDWRCHPLFRHSRCTGTRKALCVCVSKNNLLTKAEQGYRWGSTTPDNRIHCRGVWMMRRTYTSFFGFVQHLSDALQI
jgi:hypothetical protein